MSTQADDGRGGDSEAIQAIERLRAMPGNCPEANLLLDEALRVQRASELGLPIDESDRLEFVRLFNEDGRLDGGQP